MIDERATYVNTKTGEKIELDNTAPYILLTIEGAGQAGIDTQTQKAAYQDGESYIDSLLAARDMNIEILIKATNESEVFAARKQLAAVFNPKDGPGQLKYIYAGQEKEIMAIIDDGPYFPPGIDNRGPTFQRVIITLVCPSPFWEDTAKTGTILGFIAGGLTFPLMLNPDIQEHTLFSRRGFTTILNNMGNVSTPVMMIFSGPAENPKIVNSTTGEYIKINQTIGSDEKLHINTAFGQKRAEKEDAQGELSNAFHYLDLESTFWKLQVGDNAIDFESDISRDEASIKIVFTNYYVGI